MSVTSEHPNAPVVASLLGLPPARTSSSPVLRPARASTLVGLPPALLTPRSRRTPTAAGVAMSSAGVLLVVGAVLYGAVAAYAPLRAGGSSPTLTAIPAWRVAATATARTGAGVTLDPTTTTLTLPPPAITVPPVTTEPTVTVPRALAPSPPLPTRAAPPAVVPAPRLTSTRDLGNPTSNVAPSPDFRGSCSNNAYDDSSACVDAAVAAVTNARSLAGLPPLVLPANWGALTPAEQLYVATNLERTVRGLPALSAMATEADAAASAGAANFGDASPPPGFPWTRWASNWAGNLGNPLEAIYFWMYDDGPGSSNIACPPSGGGGCWQHREQVLLPLACTPCVLGAGWATTGQGTSTSELLLDTSGAPAADFTWAQEEPYLR